MITNKHNLPQAFVEMCSNRDYSANPEHYSATTMLKGIKEIILNKRHYDEVDTDVSEMIWMVFGTAVHSVLERQKCGENEIKEERLTIDFGDKTLTGQFDLYDAENKKLVDYKTASVWKIVNGDYEDWRKQLLIYAYMLRHIGFEVNSGEIVAMLKDHSKSKAKFDANYPQLPVEVVKFKFEDKDFEEIEKFLIEKFKEISFYEQMSDDDIPPCTEEERWNSGTKYAVMKQGRKTALRVFDNIEDAVVYKSKFDETHYIDYRKGEDKKCSEYCKCCEYCNYYKNNVCKGE